MKILPITPYDVVQHVLDGMVAAYGEKVALADGREFVYAYWDGSDPGALAVGTPVWIGKVGKTTIANNPAIAPCATNAVMQDVGVAITTYTTAGGVWLQTKGWTTDTGKSTGTGFCRLDGNADITAGNQLQGSNTYPTALVDDGGTALTADSVGIAGESYATNSTAGGKKVYLHGRRVTIG
ncbi:MAG: hypothetical protein ABFD94_12030 [Armatimonadia bacterium]